VCWNTFQAAEREGEQSGRMFTFRHVGDVAGRIAEARETIAGLRSETAEYVEMANELTQLNVTDEHLQQFLSEFLPNPAEQGAHVTERVQANVDAARAMFKSIYLDSVTTEGVRGTAFAAASPESRVTEQESERQNMSEQRRQLLELEEQGVPRYLIGELEQARRQLSGFGTLLTEASTRLQQRLDSVILHVNAGDSVNSLGEVHGQGGTIDVLCAGYMSALERVERALGMIEQWRRSKHSAALDAIVANRDSAVLRVTFTQTPRPNEIVELAADIAENYARPTVCQRRDRSNAFVAACEIVEQQS
jgi:hypothetical protein